MNGATASSPSPSSASHRAPAQPAMIPKAENVPAAVTTAATPSPAAASPNAPPVPIRKSSASMAAYTPHSPSTAAAGSPGGNFAALSKMQPLPPHYVPHVMPGPYPPHMAPGHPGMPPPPYGYYPPHGKAVCYQETCRTPSNRPSGGRIVLPFRSPYLRSSQLLGEKGIFEGAYPKILGLGQSKQKNVVKEPFTNFLLVLF